MEKVQVGRPEAAADKPAQHKRIERTLVHVGDRRAPRGADRGTGRHIAHLGRRGDAGHAESGAEAGGEKGAKKRVRKTPEERETARVRKAEERAVKIKKSADALLQMTGGAEGLDPVKVEEINKQAAENKAKTEEARAAGRRKHVSNERRREPRKERKAKVAAHTALREELGGKTARDWAEAEVPRIASEVWGPELYGQLRGAAPQPAAVPQPSIFRGI